MSNASPKAAQPAPVKPGKLWPASIHSEVRRRLPEIYGEIELAMKSLGTRNVLGSQKADIETIFGILGHLAERIVELEGKSK
jgi:hypothetical protein